MRIKKKRRISSLKAAGYVVGSIAVGVFASAVIPELINKGASFYYKNKDKSVDCYDDTKDVIVKKNTNMGL